MELYLIRHGETVDNIAGLYAGVRDSALTNHGAEQARRLGQHFKERNVQFDHVFSSPLTRALRTAEAIVAAQSARDASTSDSQGDKHHDITIVESLIEQNFGFYEGKSFQARTTAGKSGKDAHREKHQNDPGFVDVESKQSMMKRADTFLDDHLTPLFSAAPVASPPCNIAVVSHGMLLSTLWKRLLIRLPVKSVTVAASVVASRDNLVLEHLGGWSNTGYLHLSFSRTTEMLDVPTQLHTDTVKTEPRAEKAPLESPTRQLSTPAPAKLTGWRMSIEAIDSKDHLVNLKRQRGGIGSSAYDKGQQKLEGFFKRQRKQ